MRILFILFITALLSTNAVAQSQSGVGVRLGITITGSQEELDFFISQGRIKPEYVENFLYPVGNQWWLCKRPGEKFARRNVGTCQVVNTPQDANPSPY